MEVPVNSSLDERVAEVEAAVRALQREMKSLTQRVASGAAERAAQSPAPVVSPAPSPMLAQSEALRRLATVSFVLVVALVLRTLTDSGVVGTRLGVQLGIAYAVLLVAVGWRRLAKQCPGRNVLPICGLALLSALVLEAHVRFDGMGSSTAHALLAMALVAPAWLGLAYGAPAVAEAACLAPPLAAVAMRFPSPAFPLAAVLLAAAGLVAAAVARRRTVAWVHWAVAAVSAFFWLLWTVKLAVPLARGEAPSEALHAAWFAPCLSGTLATQVAAAAWRCRDRASPFWLLQPAFAVAWTFAAAAAVVLPTLDEPRWLGLVGLAVCAPLLGLVRTVPTQVARAAFVAGAAFAFLPSIWLLAAGWWLALPLWSAAALGIAAASQRLADTGLRLFAVALQVATVLLAVAVRRFEVPAERPIAAALLAAWLTGSALLHHRWAETHAPVVATLYARLFPADRIAVVFRWVAVAAAFLGARVLLDEALAALSVHDRAAFAGGQSVLLACFATGLLLLARVQQSRAWLGTAVLLGAVTGIKVFASDMLTLSGVPLVASVFAFGTLAAAASFVVGRWPRPVPA